LAAIHADLAQQVSSLQKALTGTDEMFSLQLRRFQERLTCIESCLKLEGKALSLERIDHQQLENEDEVPWSDALRYANTVATAAAMRAAAESNSQDLEFHCETEDEAAEFPDDDDERQHEAAESKKLQANVQKGTLIVNPGLVTVLSVSSHWPGYEKENILQADGSWMTGIGQRSGAIEFDLGCICMLSGVRLSTQGSLAGPARWPAEARLLWRKVSSGSWNLATSVLLDEPSVAADAEVPYEVEVAIHPRPVMALQVRIELRNDEVLYFPPDGLAGWCEDAGAIVVGRVHFF